MKRGCVIVAAAAPDRVAEALRAALGLSLRGGSVQVLLGAAARAIVETGARADIARAVATLRELGHEIGDATAEAVARALGEAEAIERWTDGRAGADVCIDETEGLDRALAAEGRGLAVLVRDPACAPAPTERSAVMVAERGAGRLFSGGREIDADAAIALLFAAEGALVW